MKKGLSVLLIAAALFGFYGGAVNLNDVLACKDYWEKEDERTTADLNKLEDGLNQLADNEEAYLDGLDKVADGEKQLADGEAELAKGEADYAAAPGKLAAGKAKLEEGYSSYNDLKTLIKGLNTVRRHAVSSTNKHDTYWHDGFTFNTYKTNGKAGLQPGRKLIVATLKEQANQVAMIEGLTGYENLVSSASDAKSYEGFDNVVTKKLTPAFSKAVTTLQGFAKLAAGKASDLKSASDAHAGLLQLEGQGLTNAKDEYEFVKSLPEGHPLKALESTLEAMKNYDSVPASTILRGSVAQQLTDFLNDYGATLAGVAASNPDVAALVGGMQTLANNNTNASTFGPTVDAVKNGLNDKAIPLLNQYAKSAQDSADTFKAWDAGYKTLSEGQATIASKTSGIPFAFKKMVTNRTIKAAVKQYDPKLMSILKKYKGDRLGNEDMDAFDSDLTYLGKEIIPRCLSVLAKVKSKAVKDLAAGEKQLAQGKADFAAAPGKLADGRAKLADGRKELADGKAKLAEYEDGEQQVRDGLATLMASEANGGLESILERRNGDDQFDDPNGHLDLTEGLDAVGTGREYKADSGVLVTNEITARAVGTAAGLGAAVLALLAALLGLLKKYKAAGVAAILTAVAGGGGMAYGMNAGMEFSNIAGSNVGSTPWVAFGVLACAALVHAIVHFTAKKEA